MAQTAANWVSSAPGLSRMPRSLWVYSTSSALASDVSPDAWRSVHGTLPAVLVVRATHTVVSAPADDGATATPRLATTTPRPPITRDDLTSAPAFPSPRLPRRARGEEPTWGYRRCHADRHLRQLGERRHDRAGGRRGPERGGRRLRLLLGAADLRARRAHRPGRRRPGGAPDRARDERGADVPTTSDGPGPAGPDGQRGVRGAAVPGHRPVAPGRDRG